eukprot:497462_1
MGVVNTFPFAFLCIISWTLRNLSFLRDNSFVAVKSLSRGFLRVSDATFDLVLLLLRSLLCAVPTEEDTLCGWWLALTFAFLSLRVHSTPMFIGSNASTISEK